MDMTEGEQNPRAALGTVLTWVGSVWVVFSVLWGLGVLQAIGISGTVASEVGGTIFPAIVLIGIGRALRRRARVDPNVIVPDVSPAPRPTPPILPRPDTRVDFPPPVLPPAPKPAPPRTLASQRAVVVAPVTEQPDSTQTREVPPIDELDPTPGTPKTSQELIEEARKRWGTRPNRESETGRG